jgi:hypothetical protein
MTDEASECRRKAAEALRLARKDKRNHQTLKQVAETYKRMALNEALAKELENPKP